MAPPLNPAPRPRLVALPRVKRSRLQSLRSQPRQGMYETVSSDMFVYVFHTSAASAASSSGDSSTAASSSGDSASAAAAASPSGGSTSAASSASSSSTSDEKS